MHSASIKAARSALIVDLGRASSDALKTLLESKHIYQSVSLDPAPFFERARDRLTASEQTALAAAGGFKLDGLKFFLSDRELFAVGRDEPPESVPTIRTQNLKLFCVACDEREVFAPLWAQDLEGAGQRLIPSSALGAEPAPQAVREQVFGATFRCQRCFGALNAFIVRRLEWKLTLEGRSPMEHVAMPAYVPKQEAHLYRDSLVAIHGGKVLAGLFYLRTFIEQFARRITGTTGRVTGVEILKAYAEGLPPNLRDSMPSLREWYEKLSECIHEARGDAERWNSAIEAVNQHLDIRRVFKVQP